MSRLNYKHLYYFWIVAKEGSIARASEFLHLTPPTLSAQINTLEEMLDVKLFKKAGRQLVLTEIGKITSEYAESIFLLGMELENFISNDQHQKQIQFKVGVVDVMPKLIVYRLLNPAFQLSPDIRIVCQEDKFESLLTDLAAHKLDLILADRQINPTLNIKAYHHALGSSGVTFFANKKLAKILRPDFPDSLHQQSFLLPTLDTTLRRAIDQWFDEIEISPYIIGEFADSALLKVFGQEGKGVFCAPSVIENEILKQYDVHIVGRTEAIQEQFFAITAERRIKHPAVNHIREMASSILFNKIGQQ
jgi:LysR family transcriptional activator of nhaA